MFDDVDLGTLAVLAIFGCLIVYLVAGCVGTVNNAISVDEAVARFEELAGTDDIVVVRHSNNAFVVGDPLDVTFELLVDSKPVTGRCTAGSFSPMVCRLYTGGE